MITVCAPLKARQASESARKRGVASTASNVDLKSENLNVRVGTRSSSNILRSGCRTTAKTKQAAAVISIVVRQPVHSVNCGARMPAISSPAGTAVCLIENTSGRYCGGEQRESRCELVGVDTAEPPPPMIADRIRNAGEPRVSNAMPAASSRSATWLMRKAPWRTMKLPHPSCTKSAATAVRPK